MDYAYNIKDDLLSKRNCRSKDIVELLISKNNNIKTLNFCKNVLSEVKTDDEFFEDIVHVFKSRARLVPDAYLIDKENKAIVCYEVEDTHPLNDKKILKYTDIFWALDEIYWDLILITYDIFGNTSYINVVNCGLILDLNNIDNHNA